MTSHPHSRWLSGGRIAGALTVLALVLAFAMPTPASAASAADESAFINGVNAARAAKGLPALTPDVQLTNLARGWAESMRDGTCGEGTFICHASPISAGVTLPWQKLGENVGTGPDVDSIMAAFIDSPGHYANITDPEFTHIGVGVVWEGNRMFTTHRFMKLQGATPTTTAPTSTTAAPTTTTAVPTTTAAPIATTTTTTGPTAATTNDGGSPDRASDPGSIAENTSAPDPAPLAYAEAERQASVLLAERAPVLIEAFASVS